MIYKKSIKIPLYSGRFLILFSDKEIYLRDEGYDDGEDNFKVDFAHCFFINEILENKKSYKAFMIAFNLGFDPDYNKITHGILAHELFHVTSMILEEHDIKLSHDSEEAFCYLNNWLTDETYKFIDECKIKIELLNT